MKITLLLSFSFIPGSNASKVTAPCTDKNKVEIQIPNDSLEMRAPILVSRLHKAHEDKRLKRMHNNYLPILCDCSEWRDNGDFIANFWRLSHLNDTFNLRNFSFCIYELSKIFQQIDVCIMEYSVS